LPVFRLNTYFGVGRDAKVFLNLEGGITRGPLPNTANRKKGRGGNQNKRRGGNQRNSGVGSARRDQATNSNGNGQEQTPEYMEYTEKIKNKQQELRRTKEKVRVAERAANERAGLAEHRTVNKHKRKKRMVSQEIFQLEIERRALQEGWAEDGPVTGALPDFLVIGVGKGGTTYLYHLLGQHPHVEPAATKEVHFFGNLYDEGVEWYRQNFPTPRWKDGRMTITGEASPHIAHPLAPERVAEVVPQARLIALLRNPVDRAYSRYQQMVRRGRVTRTFEEVIELEKAQLLTSTRRGRYDAEADELSPRYTGDCIYKGLYLDHLTRWAEFFDREQMLILKSEDFFTRPQEILQQVFGFLDLPEWEPDPSEFERKRNTRKYDKMSPETRRRLEEFFEPHNERLYDYLGRDLGW